jgi:exodeoxyribonuclease VIII
MPETEYHGHPALGSSQFRTFLKSPLRYKFEQTHPTIEKSSALDFGSAVHFALLQPHEFGNAVVIEPKFDRRTNAGKEAAARFEAALAPNAIRMSEQDVTRAQFIAKAIRQSELWEKIIMPLKPVFEVSVFTKIEGVDVKARFDICPAECRGVLFDLKTTMSASKWAFRNSIIKYGYHIQAAYYALAYEAETGDAVDSFGFLAVEKSGAYDFQLHEFTGDDMKRAKELVLNGLREFSTCQTFDSWNGYPKHEATLIPNLPDYAFEKGDFE